MAVSEQAFDRTHSASLLLLYSSFGFSLCSVSLSLPTKWRLWNTFGFSDLSSILSLYRSLPSAFSFSRSLSLPTESRLRNRLSTKCIRLLCNLFLCFSLSVPYYACSLSSSLSLPTLALPISRFHFRLHGRLNAADFRWNKFASLLPFLFLLFVGLIDLFRLCCTRSRQNGGFGACFRRNTFGFSATSTFLSLYGYLLPCSFSLLISLPTEWLPRYQLLRSLFLYRSLLLAISLSLSLPTAWRL
jgi:hypothetical protein